MSDNTYLTLNQNEIRNIELEVYDEDDLSYEPDSASTNLYDYQDNLKESRTCSITSNVITTTVSTSCSSIPGEYYMIWNIDKGTNKYKHKTIINVLEL